MSLATQYRIVAIVPCHNEEAAVAKVVLDLRASVPGMTVYVYDNCSTDRTVERALAAGAVVRSEPLKGKGNVVRRAFADLDADIYLIIDGDDTYDAAAAPVMIEKLVRENLDHVVGVRREVEGCRSGSAYRPAHATGNRVLNQIVTVLFGDSMGDMLSGYRVLRPMYFFGVLAGLAGLLALVLAGPVLLEYVRTGFVPRLPTLFVSSFLLVISCLGLLGGLVLDGIRKSRHESSRLVYMRYPAVRDCYVRDPAAGAGLATPAAQTADPVIPAPRAPAPPAGSVAAPLAAWLVSEPRL
jgi:hypothetical protein